jgi:hypothetical protein
MKVRLEKYIILLMKCRKRCKIIEKYGLHSGAKGIVAVILFRSWNNSPSGLA